MIGINIKMPKACMCCDLEYWAAGYGNRCSATFAETTYNREKSRHPDCPLRPLDDVIRVGDEVRNNIVESRGIVTFVWPDGDVNVVIENGTVGMWVKGMFERTGRHFDEVETMLKKMRGDNDG